jgi:hypothetical protein
LGFDEGRSNYVARRSNDLVFYDFASQMFQRELDVNQVLIGSPKAKLWNPRFLGLLPEMSFENVRHWLTQLGVLTARPAAFGIFALYGASWIAIGNGLEWHSLATLATWAMTLVIQRAEHRDTQAIHAKLDETP